MEAFINSEGYEAGFKTNDVTPGTVFKRNLLVHGRLYIKNQVGFFYYKEKQDIEGIGEHSHMLLSFQTAEWPIT